MEKAKNEMSVGDCRMLFPKKKWFGEVISPTGKALVPEESLQKYANEALWLRHWSYIRFPNYLLYWMKHNAPKLIRIMFFQQVAGKLPDNTVMVQVAPGCFLAVKVELKTADSKGRAVGKLHGKQKTYAKAEEWFIARTPEQINAVLNKIGVMAEKVREALSTRENERSEKLRNLRARKAREGFGRPEAGVSSDVAAGAPVGGKEARE